MILHKLTLNNFGLFRGKQTIQLTPNGRGSIILIGGMNGAGKTTLLDAVRLVEERDHSLLNMQRNHVKNKKANPKIHKNRCNVSNR